MTMLFDGRNVGKSAGIIRTQAEKLARIHEALARLWWPAGKRCRNGIRIFLCPECSGKKSGFQSETDHGG